MSPMPQAINNSSVSNQPSCVEAGFRRQCGQLLLGLLVAFGSSLLLPNALAQGPLSQGASQASADIEIYKGEPIYLPVAEAPPAPQETDSKKLKDTYKDSEAVRFERQVTRFSDNSFASEGPYKEFYKSGQVFSEGAYLKAVPDGAWSFYHPDGTVAKKITYDAGRPDGKVEVFSKEGKILIEREYKLGKREGAWLTYSAESGSPLTEQRYANGLPEGEWKFWFSNGELRQVQNLKDGKRNGLVTEWASTGEKRGEVNFRDGKRHGNATEWLPSGDIVERVYEDGKMISSNTTKADNS